MNVQYLEIVTLEVDATCSALEAMHAVNFGEPLPGFGNARTAALAGGGMLGVRGPLRPDEEPVVRPYLLVDDIDASVQAAEAAGAQIALPPMEMPGQGKFAIYILGGIEHGLWMR
ncbi:MAG: hydroxylase [Planctomycetota bacterium]